jgi:hypothetical protein
MASQAVEDLRDNADECYVDDVADNKPGNKLRSTNGLTEIFIIVMTLALNELVRKRVLDLLRKRGFGSRRY